MVGLPSTDLGSVRSCCNSERNKAYVDSDIAATLPFGTRLVAAPRVNVGCKDVETDIPAGTVPSDGGEDRRSNEHQYSVAASIATSKTFCRRGKG